MNSDIIFDSWGITVYEGGFCYSSDCELEAISVLVDEVRRLKKMENDLLATMKQSSDSSCHNPGEFEASAKESAKEHSEKR